MSPAMRRIVRLEKLRDLLHQRRRAIYDDRKWWNRSDRLKHILLSFPRRIEKAYWVLLQEQGYTRHSVDTWSDKRGWLHDLWGAKQWARKDGMDQPCSTDAPLAKVRAITRIQSTCPWCGDANQLPYFDRYTCGTPVQPLTEN